MSILTTLSQSFLSGKAATAHRVVTIKCEKAEDPPQQLVPNRCWFSSFLRAMTSCPSPFRRLAFQLHPQARSQAPSCTRYTHINTHKPEALHPGEPATSPSLLRQLSTIKEGSEPQQSLLGFSHGAMQLPQLFWAQFPKKPSRHCA